MKDELFCPKCNADLRKQFGFYEGINVWICEKCDKDALCVKIVLAIPWFMGYNTTDNLIMRVNFVVTPYPYGGRRYAK